MSLDPNQYLRMRALFGISPGTPSMPNQPVNPWANVSMTGGDSTSVPSSPPLSAQPAQISVPAMQPSASPIDMDAEIARLGKQFPMENNASDRFNELIQKYPRAEDFHPSVLRRIASGIVSASGGFDPRGLGFYKPNAQTMEAGQNLLNQPYTKQLSDWKNEIQPAYEAANLERYTNANNRQIMFSTVSNELKEQAERDRVSKNENDAAIKEQRAQIYDMRSRGFKFNFGGPTVLATDPISGRVMDTKVPTGALNALDKMTIGQDYALERIGLQNEGRIRAAEAAGRNLEPTQVDVPGQPGVKAAGVLNKVTRQVSPITGTGILGPQAPGQTPPVLGFEAKTGGTGQTDLNNLRYTARDALNSIDNMLSADKQSLNDQTKSAVGLTGLAARHIPTTQGYAGGVAIKALQSKLTLELFQQMKEMSRSGSGGFGRLTNTEFQAMQTAAANLDPGMDSATFTKNLLAIREKLQKIMADPYSGTQAPVTTKPETTEDLYKRLTSPNYKAPKQPGVK